MNYDSGMEYEFLQKDESGLCELCGEESDNLTCGYEWDLDRCCSSCADEKAFEEEMKHEIP